MTYSNDRRPLVTLLLLLLVVILLFLGLGGSKCPPQIARADTVRETITRIIPHDTTVYLTDSAGILAALECDSLGKIRIKQIQQYYEGKIVKPSIVIHNNQAQVKCIIDSGAVALHWNETHIVTTESTHTVTVPPVVNYVTGFQWFQIWLARIMIIAGVLYGIYYTAKSFTWWTVLIGVGSKLVTKVINKSK